MTLDNTSNGDISDFNMPRLKSKQSSDRQKEVMEPGNLYSTRRADSPKRKANLNDLDKLQRCFQSLNVNKWTCWCTVRVMKERT